MSAYSFWMVEFQGQRETYSRSFANDWYDLPDCARTGHHGESIFRIWCYSKSWRDAIQHARMVYRDSK